MANPNPTEPEVKGKDLLKRGFDFFFGKLGDSIHGATQKDPTQGDETSKDDQATNPGAPSKDKPTPKDGEAAPSIEAEGEEVPSTQK